MVSITVANPAFYYIYVGYHHGDKVDSSYVDAVCCFCRLFDNVRFVEHSRLKRGDAEALALSALAEVPNQYRAIRSLGLLGGKMGLEKYATSPPLLNLGLGLWNLSLRHG